MIIDTSFNGRIIQVIESLDFGDAVSNCALNLDKIFRESGFRTGIYAKWFHEKVGGFWNNIDDLVLEDTDVVIVHYSGFSKYVFPVVKEQRCARVLLYHNITPEKYFDPSTETHHFCLSGREQLKEVVDICHFYWADSQYNLDELISLGADPEKSRVLPIVVPPPASVPGATREEGTWLFVGRIAGNKGQVDLVRQFAEARKETPELARKLYLVGRGEPSDPYFLKLQGVIKELRLTESVVVTGKIPDADVLDYFQRAAVYVSMSRHEGFGVPLIEAAHHGLPVVALDNTAVGETMGGGLGAAGSPDDLKNRILRVLGDPDYRDALMAHQRSNLRRFSRYAVESSLTQALGDVLPSRSRFSTVSIVICTYNRSDLLDRCLDYLQYQTNRNFEVVVVNGPSTDDTLDVVEKYKDRVKFAQNDKANLSISRNMGIEMSSGDIVAFIDDDALPFDDWVDTILTEFNKRPLTLAGLGGPVFFAGTLDYQDQDIAINKLAETRKDIGRAVGKDGWERSLLGTNCCFRADVLREVKGFDEQFEYFLDESELTFRIQKEGYIVSYSEDLYLRHEFAQSANRQGNYRYNWYAICKNTAYFIAAYSGMRGKKLREYIEARFATERIQPLRNALAAGEVTAEEYETYEAAIKAGTAQGLADAAHFPRTRALKVKTDAFKPFSLAGPFYPMIGRDTDRLHICVVTKEFKPFVGMGGIGTMYHNLVSELLLMGHYITVIVPGPELPVYRRGRLTVRYTQFNAVCEDDAKGFANNVNWSLSALHELAEVHVEHPVDVVDSSIWDSETLSVALLPSRQRPPLVIRLVTPFPVAVRMNNWTVDPRENELFRWAEKTLIDNADAIVPISGSIGRTIEAEYEVRRDGRWLESHCGIAYWPYFDVRTNYTDLPDLNGKPLPGADARVVLYVGRLEGRKGIGTLLHAANEVLEAAEDAHLVVAGRDIEGWADRLTTLLKPELAERVHMLGEVDDATRDKLIKIAYCTVFPSLYESFGLVPLECFVHGVPVIAARAGAIPEVVDEDTGILFPPEDSAALAAALKRLLGDPDMRDRLARGAKQRVRTFNSRAFAARSVSAYCRLLTERRENI